MNTDEFEEISFLVDEKNLVELKKIIEADKDIVNSRDRMERTLLIYANTDEHYEIAKYLIEAGADINTKDTDNWRPIHFASQNASSSIVKLLVEQGAEVDAEDNNGKTPLSNVVRKVLGGNNDMKELQNYLIEHGADMKHKNFHGVSPEDILNY
jgi:ankyrin repeat protein